MRSYNNLSEVFLLTHGCSPKERKANPEICIAVKNGNELAPGDEIKGNSSPEHISVYTIEEIKEKRPAAMPGYTFIRAISNWQLRKFHNGQSQNVQKKV